jgi:TonB-linked SusC/RagA family outer membrane protein
MQLVSNYKTLHRAKLYLIKILLIMKLTTCLLLFACLQVSARGVAQKVTLNEDRSSLGTVLKKIENQTGYTFLYETTVLNKAYAVTLHVKEEPVDQVLKLCFKNQPLTYKVFGSTVVIKEKIVQYAFQRESQLIPLANVVSGKVTNSQGEPLAGVSVTAKGTTTGTSTNAKGSYSIDVPRDGILVFSYVGFKTKEVPVGGKITINVVMQTSVERLEDVVVIGFGEQTKRNVTGTVSSVDMGSMEKDNSTTVTQQLEGKVSGVSVIRSTGRLGSPTRINIRGVSSINASSEPLYVIDGVPVEETSSGSGEDISPFVNLNTDDIKSIDVLKGASAAAIYGTRGANGVIIITTKSGKSSGKSVVRISADGGNSWVAKKLNIANTSQYLTIYNYLRGTSYQASEFANTDWQDAVSQGGSLQKYNVSVSGGDKKNTYYLSANYDDEKGTILNNNLTKFGARLKVTNKLSDRLDVSLNLAPSFTKLRSLGGHTNINTAFGMAVLVPPTVPIYLPNGALNNGKDPSASANIIFNPFAGTPYANVENSILANNRKQLLSTLGGNYKILSNLTFSTNFNYINYSSTRNDVYKNNTNTGYPNGQLGANSWEFTNLSWNNSLNYKKNWADDNLEVTLVSVFENSSRNFFSLSKNNVTEESLTDLDAASEILSAGGATSSFRYQNNVVRFSYNHKRKYLLTASGSYDGTSRFAKGKRYGFFPAVSAGWIISDEDFMQNSKSLGFLKLRVGYGLTGNANIGDYDYLPLLTSDISYNEEPGLDFTQLANPELTWETSKEFDIGLDFSFFKDRFHGAIDFYRRMTTNLLLQRRISDINGFTTIFKNGGKMLNSGVEFNFVADIVKNKNFRWSLNGNISSLHNKVIDLPGGDILGTFPNLIRQGESIASFYMPVYKGVDPENGNALFENAKGEATPNYSEAPRQIVGSPLPKFFGGFGTTLSYKAFDFSANFNYTSGNKLYWVRAEYMKGATSTYNQLVSVLDFWTPDNKDAPNPEPRLNPNGGNRSTRFLYNASFLRLNYIQLGYNFPKHLIGEQKARIYIGGTNLFTVTSFEGFDPSSDNNPRSNISRGIVQGNDPLSMGITAGLQVTF